MITECCFTKLPKLQAKKNSRLDRDILKIIIGISNYRIRFQEQKSFIKSLSFNCLIKGNTGNDYFYYFSGNLSPIFNETSKQTAFIYFRGDNMHCHIYNGGCICLRSGL
jgi:hypothetical protein